MAVEAVRTGKKRRNLPRLHTTAADTVTMKCLEWDRNSGKLLATEAISITEVLCLDLRSEATAAEEARGLQ